VEELAVGGFLADAVAREGISEEGRDPAELRDMLHGDTPEDRLLDAMLRTGRNGDHFGLEPDGLTLARLMDEPHGIDLGPLTPQLPELLSTPSRKVELAPGPVLEDLHRLAGTVSDPVPPVVLVGRRHLRSNNSWMHNVEVLVKGRPRCTLQVHPDDAAKYGLTDGGRAQVRSRAGCVEADIEVTDVVMRGVVSLPHGWGHDLDGTRLSVASAVPGVNSNLLTDAAATDPLSGNAVLNGIPVTLAAVP